MMSKQTYRLGDLQLRIMRVLWNLGPASVAQVQDRLEGDPLAYTTVATMLRKMEDRGLVRHREHQRRFIYEAAVTAEDVTRSMADDLVDRLFEGSLADAVSHLLQTREVSPRELARLEQLIQERKGQR
ncbi:MAG TPA: BlaI/MecI/CopY family transcriptional regulator [Thermoguttaceae bacterium]|nr:BlaI/MecI/CopY family transcriptional regulator [Thermoguttaceae bacterium]